MKIHTLSVGSTGYLKTITWNTFHVFAPWFTLGSIYLQTVAVEADDEKFLYKKLFTFCKTIRRGERMHEKLGLCGIGPTQRKERLDR